MSDNDQTKMAETLAAKMNGKYKLERSENFDEYLTERGANWLARKMAGGFSPTMEVHIEGDNLKMKIYVPVKTFTDVNCKFGEEVEGVRGDGAKLKTKYWLEDGKLMSVQRDDKGEDRITREMVDDDTVVMTMKAGNVQCKRFFKRVPHQ